MISFFGDFDVMLDVVAVVNVSPSTLACAVLFASQHHVWVWMVQAYCLLDVAKEDVVVPLVVVGYHHYCCQIAPVMGFVVAEVVLVAEMLSLIVGADHRWRYQISPLMQFFVAEVVFVAVMMSLVVVGDRRYYYQIVPLM